MEEEFSTGASMKVMRADKKSKLLMVLVVGLSWRLRELEKVILTKERCKPDLSARYWNRGGRENSCPSKRYDDWIQRALF